MDWSLALLADAGHMLTDVAGLSMSLLAGVVRPKPPTTRRTPTAICAQILAAVAGNVLFLVAGYILYEAVLQVWAPPRSAPAPCSPSRCPGRRLTTARHGAFASWGGDEPQYPWRVPGNAE